MTKSALHRVSKLLMKGAPLYFLASHVVFYFRIDRPNMAIFTAASVMVLALVMYADKVFSTEERDRALVEHGMPLCFTAADLVAAHTTQRPQQVSTQVVVQIDGEEISAAYPRAGSPPTS